MDERVGTVDSKLSHMTNLTETLVQNLLTANAKQVGHYTFQYNTRLKYCNIVLLQKLWEISNQ